VENLVKLASDGSLKRMMGENSLINSTSTCGPNFLNSPRNSESPAAALNNKLRDRMFDTWAEHKEKLAKSEA
jgi:hypothetical protein